MRLGTFLAALICSQTACGGSEFDRGSGSGAGSGGSGAAGSGGSAGSGGVSATGGMSGSGGSTPGTGGSTTGGSGGGGSGSAGADAGTDASAGSAGISVVQASQTAVAAEDVPTLTLPAPPGAGNAIIVGITCISDYLGDCVIPTPGVSDNHANVYTRIVQGEALPSSSQAARGYIFIAENIAAASDPVVISVDPDGTTTNQRVVWGAIEVAGLTASSLDVWGSSLVASETSTTAVTDLSTTQANELAVAVFSMRSDDTNMLITPEAGWTTHHIQQNGASGPPGHSMVSRLLTELGVVSHTWTHDAPTRSAAAIIATFKGAAAN